MFEINDQGARRIAEALVDDPLTQIVMRADHIGRDELLDLLSAAVLASRARPRACGGTATVCGDAAGGARA